MTTGLAVWGFSLQKKMFAGGFDGKLFHFEVFLPYEGDERGTIVGKKTGVPKLPIASHKTKD